MEIDDCSLNEIIDYDTQIDKLRIGSRKIEKEIGAFEKEIEELSIRKGELYSNSEIEKHGEMELGRKCG